MFTEYFVLDMTYYVFDFSDWVLLDFQKAQPIPRHSTRILTDIARSLPIQALIYYKLNTTSLGKENHRPISKTHNIVEQN